MATTSALKLRLVQIRQELAVSPVMMFGRSAQEGEDAKQGARLEQLGDHIRLIIRELKSSSNLLQLRQQALWQNVPKDKRWSASMSLKQQNADIGAVMKEAAGLLNVVMELLRKNGLGNPMQVAKDLSDLLENFEKVFGHEAGVKIAEIQHITQGPSYVPGHGADPITMEPHQFVPLLAVIYLGLKWLARKRKRQ
jgi:hypothetical protein